MARALARPELQARFSPMRGARTPARRIRVVKAPWVNVPVRSIRREWLRAAPSSLASARSGRRPCALRTWFITVRRADSERVKLAVSAAPVLPAAMRAMATAATPVRTRLATSGRYVSTDCGQKGLQSVTIVTREREKRGREHDRARVHSSHRDVAQPG